MNPADLPSACSGLPAGERCEASLPDSPQCAPNYHFGMLLGVEDFQAEQGFHLGHQRRHQRLLHGAGVVAGFPVEYQAATFELRVGPGYGIDILGRDLMLDDERCVNLALWWDKHQKDDAFDDIKPGVTEFDLDIVACYANCLARPVPAIAEPCAGDAADIAYSRICEISDLAILRHQAGSVSPTPGSYHLLRVWLGLEQAARDAEGKLLPDDQWLADAIAALHARPADQQEAARQALRAEVQARAIAATSPFAPDIGSDEGQTCLLLARLRGVKVTRAAEDWSVQVSALELGARAGLLPSQLLQDLLLAEGAAAVASGPIIVPGGVSLAATELALVFDQALAGASVSANAFAVSEFDAVQGWKLFAPGSAVYDEADPTRPTVRLTLDRAPGGARLRVVVMGTGSAPLLGSTLIPAGALRADGDGRDLATTLSL
uniref:hypothetical protein n=1 Tax=Cupriavidus yeoncheonensis TaxID=1462994 RepID=UPI003F494F26